MQQAVLEEGSTSSGAVPYEPSTCSYDDLFPALPESTTPAIPSAGQQQYNAKMRVSSTIVTQVFRYISFGPVPFFLQCI